MESNQKLEEAIRYLNENPRPIISSKGDITDMTINRLLGGLKTEIKTTTHFEDHHFVIAFLETIKTYPTYGVNIKEGDDLMRIRAEGIVRDLFDNLNDPFLRTCAGNFGGYSALRGDFNKGWELYQKLKSLR